MIYYKIDIITELRKKGYNVTRIRQENLIPQATLQNLREGKPITFKTLDTICRVLNKQPAQIIGYRADEGAENSPS